MNVTVRVPDELAARLAAESGDLERCALETLVLEEFRAGRLSEAKPRRVLGFEVLNGGDGFLKAHGVFEEYSPAELGRDVEVTERPGF
jgi:hypothetical protein